MVRAPAPPARPSLPSALLRLGLALALLACLAAPGAAENFRKEILNWERVIFIFKKSKEHKLRSPMGIKYKLIHYVDRLEFYIDGKLREKILY
jgi:hypothetical protein